ncbi:hypothetical protein GEMRC1_011958 [Eukaryota sp. GEM-RC1]
MFPSTSSVIFLNLFITLAFCTICQDLTPERTNYANISVSGLKDWSISYGRSVWSSPPFITPDIVYFSTSVGLISVDLRTGEQLANVNPSTLASAQLHMSEDSSRIATLSFPKDGSRNFHVYTADLSSEVARISVTVPGTVVSDDRGLLFSDQNLMVRFNFRGVQLHRTTSLNYATFHPCRLGYIRHGFNQLDVINKDLRLLFTLRYPGISTVVSDMTSGMFFFSYSDIMQHPDQILIAGIHDSNREIFVRNMTRVNNFHQVLFLAVTSDGSVVFGVGSRTSNSFSLSIYKIQLTGHGFEEIELVVTLSSEASYQSHVLYPSNLMAISYTDETNVQPLAKIVLIDLNSHMIIDSIEYENSKGGSMVGYGNNCLLYITKGRYNVPNTLHNTCFLQ